MSTDITNNLLCEIDHSCLVLIDIQEKLTATVPPKVRQRMERNAHRLLAAAGKLDIPVIATLQYPKGLGPMTPDLQNNLPPNTPVIEKTCFSCMAEPAFRDHLASLNRRQVLLLGMETHVCVLQTAMELKTSGYQPWVPVDATSARIRDNYDFGLTRLQYSGINVTSTESILFEWLRDSKHPLFKEISELIKGE